jgi:Cytochrome C oxidase, cbb3-type, subunit III
VSELLTSAAAALGIPEPLVKRAAEARATETGMSVDEVLGTWAGGGAIAAPAPAQAAPTEADPVEAEPEVAIEPAASPAPAGTVVPAAALAPAAMRAPTPTEVTLREAARLPEVITVPTAGIRERTNSSIPRWLTTVLLAAPLIALFALGGSATGQCGEATELTTDVVTGDIVNCDGSEFTGKPTGGGSTDFVALGESIYNGLAVSGVNCSTCHGAGGQGGGAFPALSGVLTTFGACADQLEWVGLGSAGFRAAGRETYGDTGKNIAGGMPGFSSSLSAEQLAAVVAFERVRFGAGDQAAVGVDCGLIETPEEEPGENGESGEGTAPPTTAPEARSGRTG